MSILNFLHSGGDKVTLTTPTNNPSTNPIFKLPQADGSAGQFLKTDGSGALSFATALTGPTAPSWTTAASFDCASATPSALEVTGLSNPQVIMYVFHELKHSASSRCVMQIGNDSSGYQASGYFDIGTYRTAGSTDPVSTRGHNQSQWYPLDYNFTNTTNLYSGKIVLTRTFNRWSYQTSCDVSYSGSNTQYEIMWRGHNRNFSSALNRIKLINDGGGTFTSGYVTILTQS
tara:strand:- start:414 stop:1106 length:693 start_codon:yes stop_codon:yes gene_type:complete